MHGDNGVAYTPEGLAFAGSEGQLRNNANAALLGLVYARYSGGGDGILRACWARRQVICRCLLHDPDTLLHANPVLHADDHTILCTIIVFQPLFKNASLQVFRRQQRPSSEGLAFCVHHMHVMDITIGDVALQVQYVLGSSGRSYMVGWGIDPPTHIPNPAASCPASVQPCSGFLASSPQYSSPDQNPHVLSGALVSGPDSR